MQTILLKTPSMQGKIHIGADAIAARLPALTAGQQNFVVTDSNVYALYSEWIKKYFQNAEIYVIPAGEKNKSFQVLGDILQKMSGAGMRRNARVFAFGGGVVGDMAGLAAALYMRGVSYVQIPTTLLAQVDSSVGGKTAVDLNGVKNIVGAFYQPCEVLVSPEFLTTLSARELKCGLGEIVKYAALNAEIFKVLVDNANRLTDLAFLSSLTELCIRHKAQVVERDEKENGERKSLNVGHTTGHAVELHYGLSHGESVLYGMLFETELAIENGVCDKAYGENLLKLIRTALEIAPNSVPDFSTIGVAAQKAKLDKKNTQNNQITMAVAKDEGVWTTLTMPFEDYRESLEEFI